MSGSGGAVGTSLSGRLIFDTVSREAASHPAEEPGLGETQGEAVP